MYNTKIREITGVGILAAVVIVLQLIANYVTFGSVNITLSLIPIVIGSILYGKNAGALLGVINGVVIIFAPFTMVEFMPHNAFATVILCLFKTGMAGYISGLIYEVLNKKNFALSIILASISVPIINTGIFAIGTMLLFKPILEKFSPEGQNIYAYLFLGFIGINFIIELLVNSLLSPTITYIIKTFNKLGFKK